MEIPERETRYLSRTERDDLYSGKKEVLKVQVPSPLAFEELFKEINQRFPDLSYYDVDIPLILRYAAAFNVFPLAYCKVEVEQGWNISSITALDTPWELDPKLPNLRILHIQPDTNPAHAEPKYLSVEFQQFKYRLSFEKPREILGVLNTLLNQYNPDVILTSYGDTWLFTRLEELSKETGIPFNPNRDLSRSIRRKKDISFHNYGQAHYRGEQVHLFGRWHIDDQNCMTFGDYGLMGAIEQARVCGLPITRDCPAFAWCRHCRHADPDCLAARHLDSLPATKRRSLQDLRSIICGRSRRAGL